MGSRSPMGKGNFEGRRASRCKVYGHSAVICLKTAKPIEMPFRLWARMGPKIVLDGFQIPHAKGQLLGEMTCPGMPEDNRPLAVQKWLNRSIYPHGRVHWRHLAHTIEPSVYMMKFIRHAGSTTQYNTMRPYVKLF